MAKRDPKRKMVTVGLTNVKVVQPDILEKVLDLPVSCVIRPDPMNPMPPGYRHVSAKDLARQRRADEKHEQALREKWADVITSKEHHVPME